MTQSILSIAFFLGVLLCVPIFLKWFKQRTGASSVAIGSQTTFVGALAVGPHQRVVTVDVGPEGSRQRLILGVTPQSITCLHTMPVESNSSSIEGAV